MFNPITKCRKHGFDGLLAKLNPNNKRMECSSDQLNGFWLSVLLAQTVGHEYTAFGYYVGVTGNTGQQ